MQGKTEPAARTASALLPSTCFWASSLSLDTRSCTSNYSWRLRDEAHLTHLKPESCKTAHATNWYIVSSRSHVQRGTVTRSHS
eukprot:6385537-Amphidinium_carterae.1